MEQAVINNILQAIKSNDLDIFSRLVKGNENLSYGRFPLLSVCYMYKANKIIKKHYDTLRRIKVYSFTQEPIELYEKFKSIAGKCIRLYVNNVVVSPLEMLALQHKDVKVKFKYSAFPKNDTIIKNLTAIYTMYGQKIKATQDSIKIGLPRLTYKEQKQRLVAVVVSSVFVVALVGCFVMTGLTLGVGSETLPFKIHTENQLYSALSKNSHFVLTSDLTLTRTDCNLEFGGTLDGQNHTLTIDSLPSGALISKNLGSIKNLTIKYGDLTGEISKSQSLFVGENSGEITNINISCDSLQLACHKSNESDIYVSAFASKNSGTINNCNLQLSLNLVGDGNGECYASGFVGENSGNVKNCTFVSGSINTEVIDIAGIVAHNDANGEISKCVNNANISQASNQDGWSPNAGGIVMTNYGVVKDSINKGEVKINSTLEGDSVEGEIYMGGVCAINYGDIDKCLNKGNLDVESKRISSYVGGIVAISQVYVNSANQICASTITNCGSLSEINVTSEHEKGYVYVGGIVGLSDIYTYYMSTSCVTISNCYSLSTLKNTYDEEKCFIGTFAGLCYADSYYVYLWGSNNHTLEQESTSYIICVRVIYSTIYSGIESLSGNAILKQTEAEIKQSGVYWNE